MILAYDDPRVTQCAEAGAEACGLPLTPVLKAVAMGILNGDDLSVLRRDPRGPAFRAGVLSHAETLPALSDSEGIKQLHDARSLVSGVDGARK